MYVNEQGLGWIAHFLSEFHREWQGLEPQYIPLDVLRAWARDAEFDTDSPSIEIPGRHSATGSPVILQLTSKCLSGEADHD